MGINDLIDQAWREIPRDVFGREMVKLLQMCGYNIVKENGNHIRLASI